MRRLLLVLGGVVVVAVLIWRPPSASPPISTVTENPSGSVRRGHRPNVRPSSDAIVYVAGAVLHPGLYQLHAGARVDDGVRAAGGFRGDADTGAVNLAAHVSDGDEIYVTVLGEPTPRAARARRGRQSSKKAAVAAVNVNVATAQELAMVPGIGKTLAARIVEVRERDGAYASFDQLLDVAGMTASRLEHAEPYLRI